MLDLPELDGTLSVHLRRWIGKLPGGHDPGFHKNQGMQGPELIRISMLIRVILLF